jgi:hypothetical protein
LLELHEDEEEDNNVALITHRYVVKISIHVVCDDLTSLALMISLLLSL